MKAGLLVYFCVHLMHLPHPLTMRCNRARVIYREGIREELVG